MKTPKCITRLQLFFSPDSCRHVIGGTPDMLSIRELHILKPGSAPIFIPSGFLTGLVPVMYIILHSSSFLISGYTYAVRMGSYSVLVMDRARFLNFGPC